VSSLKVSAWLSTTWPVEDLIAVANEVEQAAYHGIWLADHFMFNTETEERSDDGLHECLTLLAGLAVAVPRVRLGSLVAGITYRHPAVLAAIASTIDHLSGGRFVLGIGTGWQLNEHAAYGIELGSVPERIDRFEEAVVVLRGLLTEPRTTVNGKYYTVTDAPLEPKPVQSRLPILIGAGGERRMLGIVAAAADEWNCWSTPDVFAQKSAVLDEHCDRIGRDRASIWRTTQAIVQLDKDDDGGPVTIGGSVDQVVDAVGQWQLSGLNEWIVPGFGPPALVQERYHRIMSEVLPQLS
jgi:alkanesulfonate monooxygenase SsuD/methylene tetrahydromethanopterin reductase-like flavin-dependent oxidoreductase (luciferase family)